MREYSITDADEGRRLDKYITGRMNFPVSFLYKMLRKKNIVLNGKKASGNELLSNGDIITLYLSDETIDGFLRPEGATDKKDLSSLMPPIVYEDDDVMILDKPVGMLSQKASSTDISLNEICLSYVLKHQANEKPGFVPSVCNRLDRNTSGLITFAKTYRAARALSEALRNRTIHKYYTAVAIGCIDKDIEIKGRIRKDGATNKVSISVAGDTGALIDTRVHPLSSNNDITLIDVLLITGKTHQIRASLAHIGHPLLGDAKYGNRSINADYKSRYGVSSQLLVCSRMEFPEELPLKGIAGKKIEIDVPKIFKTVM